MTMEADVTNSSADDSDPYPEVPHELKERRQWVGWAWEERGGELTKVPKRGGERWIQNASSTDSSTWMSHEQAVNFARVHKLAGIGYVFAADDPYAGIDLDDCRNSKTGKIDAWAERIIEHADSYAEVSPSGTGVKIIGEGVVPKKHSLKSGRIEVYDAGRFFTITGDRLDGSPSEVRPIQRTLNQIYADLSREASSEASSGHSETTRGASGPGNDLSDEEVLFRARNGKNGERFRRLYDEGDTSGYGSKSEADLALVGELGYWTAGDREQIDRLFRRSALMREKWDERHHGDGRTYGEGTIDKALSGRTEDDYYLPPKREKSRFTPRPLDAATLMATEFPEPKWAVKGLIPEGLTLLAGKAKIGKSWMALDTAVSVAGGWPVLGKYHPTVGDVLYLALEDNPRRLQDRLKTVLDKRIVPQRRTSPTGELQQGGLFFEVEWPRLQNGGLEALEWWIDDHPDGRLIVIDVLARVKGDGRQHRGNAYELDYNEIAPLQQLAQKHGVAIVALHHLRKADSDDPVALISGSLGQIGPADGILILRRKRTQQEGTLFVTGRDIKDEQELAVIMLGARWAVQGDAAKVRISR
jgi:putative DNA primase/helicase